jgi:hypothetical protein
MQTLVAILQIALLSAGVFVLTGIRRDISRLRKQFAPSLEDKQKIPD